MSSRVQTVTLDYVPRAAFLPFHNRSKRKMVIVAHRRAGETYSVIQDLVARALNFQKKNPKTDQYFSKPVFAHVCPYRGRPRKSHGNTLSRSRKASLASRRTKPNSGSRFRQSPAPGHASSSPAQTTQTTCVASTSTVLSSMSTAT